MFGLETDSHEIRTFLFFGNKNGLLKEWDYIKEPDEYVLGHNKLGLVIVIKFSTSGFLTGSHTGYLKRKSITVMLHLSKLF